MDATRCGHKTFQDTRGSYEAWRSKPDPEQEECSLTFRHTRSRRSGVSLARDSIAHGNTNVPSRYENPLNPVFRSSPFRISLANYFPFRGRLQSASTDIVNESKTPTLITAPRTRVLINEHIPVAQRVHVANRNREYSPEFLCPISPVTTTSIQNRSPLRPSRSEALEIYIRTSRPIFSRLVSRSSGT